MPNHSSANEPHSWEGKTPEEVLEALVYELYPPVSALGEEIDRLTSGTFADDELMVLLEQLRSGVNHLSRIVVSLKRYTKEQRAADATPTDTHTGDREDTGIVDNG